MGDDKSKNERRKKFDWDEKTKWLLRGMMSFLISNKGFLHKIHRRSYLIHNLVLESPDG